MKKLYPYLFVALSVFLPGCSITSLAPSSSASDCAAAEISEDDIDLALNFGGGLFPKADWARKYTVAEKYVYAEWTHRSQYAVVTVNTIILCDTDMKKLRGYFNTENIGFIFSNYDEYEAVTACETNGLLLYEFRAIHEAREYNAWIWAKPLDTPHHAEWAMLVFPDQNPELMARYGGELFPELPACAG